MEITLQIQYEILQYCTFTTLLKLYLTDPKLIESLSYVNILRRVKDISKEIYIKEGEHDVNKVLLKKLQLIDTIFAVQTLLLYFWKIDVPEKTLQQINEDFEKEQPLVSLNKHYRIAVELQLCAFNL